MSITGFAVISGDYKEFSLPANIESLQERGIVRDEADFLTNSMGTIKCDSVIGVVIVPDNSPIEKFNTAAQVLLNSADRFGQNLRGLYQRVYDSRFMEVDKLLVLPDKVQKISTFISFPVVAEYYIGKGEFGIVPEEVCRWLDLYAMGESLAEQHKLFWGTDGFYEIRE